MTKKKRVKTFFLIALVGLSFPAALWGQGSGALGTSTGDGSTPFTGLARAPEANLFIGSATTEIPIQVPPGRAGIQPQLALRYSSHAGPSLYGYGWDLPLGHVQRSTRQGAVRCGKEPQTFLIALPEAQVECLLDGERCWPTVEESFLRIHYDAAANTWRIWDRSGRRYEFGTDAAAREPAVPLPGCSTFRWYLSRVEDLNGNFLTIQYETNARRDTSYPVSILYTGSTTSPMAIPFEVRFVWRTNGFSCPDGRSSGRPCDDRIIDATGGYPREYERLLDRIEVLRFGYRARFYGFEYEFDLRSGERPGRRSFLSAVTLYDGSGNALGRADGQPASTTFLYEDLRGRFGFAGTQSGTKPTFGISYSESAPDPDALRREVRYRGDRAVYRDVLDMNGDGFPDLVDITNDCLEWDPVTGFTLVAAHWNVHAGSLNGFQPQAAQWDIFQPANSLAGAGDCPALRLTRSNDDGVSWTDSDTFDITGDGVPDYVSNHPWTSTYPFWMVFPGIRPTVSGGQWRFGEPLLWRAPARELRRSEGGLHYLGHDGSADTADLLDFNGDGRLDYVTAPIGSGDIQVWHNTGSGFEETPSVFRTPWLVLRFTTNSGLQVAGMADMNGDGLVDQVLAWDRSGGRPYAGKWLVLINAGSRTVGPLDWPLPRSGCRWDGIRQALDRGEGDVVRDLFDINGDGLPDLVESCQSGTRSSRWRVYLNRGAGFQTSAIDWPAPQDAIRAVTRGNFGVTRFTADVFDADHDGMVDFVRLLPDHAALTRNAAGAWCPSGNGLWCEEGGSVALRTSNVRTDILVQMENGIGGITYLDYDPANIWDNTDFAGVWRLPWSHWTLSEITVDDGWCSNSSSPPCPAPHGAHRITSTFTYAYGLYEPEAREFRGFRVVARSDSLGGRRMTFFHQDAVRNGKKEASLQVDPQDRLLSYETESWQCVGLSVGGCGADPSGCPLVGCPQIRPEAERFWARRNESLRYDTENFIIRKVRGSRNLAWDAWGNVIRTQRFGSGTPTIETITVYTPWDEPQRYLVDHAVEGWTLNHANNRIEQRFWHEYDWRGNLVATYRWVDSVLGPLANRFAPCPGGGFCTRTRMTYDPFGNLTISEDTEGLRTEQFYDEDSKTYVIETVNPLGQHVKQLFNPVCGTKIEESIPHYLNQWPFGGVPVARWQYDTFCRLRAHYRSGDPPSRPYLRMRHVIGGVGQPSVVAVEQLASSSRRVARYQLFDAFGRLVQTQRDAYVDRRRTSVIESTRFYDARGRLIIDFAPFTVIGARGNFVPPPIGHGATTLEYDLLDRPTQRTAPDGAVTRFEYNEAWTTTTIDPCSNAGTCEGARTFERRDAFGRVVERLSFSSDNRFLQGTFSRYDAFGRVVETLQATGPGVWDPATTARFAYDTRGLLIQHDDPNSGVWDYGYDPNGNLVYINDPKPGRHISLCYDAVGRLVAKYYSTSGDGYTVRCNEREADVRYAYDYPAFTSDPIDGSVPAGAVSRLTAVYEGNNTNLLFYDLHGRVVANRITLNLPGEPPTQGTMRWTYDAAGNVTSLTYPDGERVRYRYDPAGQVYGVIGDRLYARRISYDLFGRPRELALGNGLRDIREYRDFAGNFRLASARTERPGRVLQQLDYASYSANGLLEVLREPNAPDVADLDRNTSFTYDGLGRLRTARFQRTTTVLDYQYDPIGNIVQKEGTTLFYARQRPHQAVAIDGFDQIVQYDDNGNRTRKGNTAYEYDAENRLVRVDGGAVEFAYDQAGNRLGRRLAGGRWVRTYFGLAEASDGFLTKYYFAGKILIASQRVPNTTLAATRSSGPIRLAALTLPSGTPVLEIAVRPDVAPLLGLALLATLLCLCAVPGRTRPMLVGRLRRGPILALTVAFGITTFPWPLLVRPAQAQAPRGEFAYYHLNHLGSTEMVTSESGAVMLHIRYAPFGGLLGYFGPDGRRLGNVGCEQLRACRDFTGYQRESAIGLHYAGARFYDSDIALFQTHDPARQFANPYTYAAWNPTNLTDANGELIEWLIFAIVTIVLSTAITVVAAAAQGLPLSQLGKAAIAGAIGGAVGIGLGLVGLGISTVLTSIASTLPQNAALGSAVAALQNVSVASALSTVASFAAKELGKALGLPEHLLRLGADVAGGVAKIVLNHKGPGDGGKRGGEGPAPTGDPSNLAVAQHDLASPAESGDGPQNALFRASFAHDTPGGSLWAQPADLANNATHFGFGAQHRGQSSLGPIAAGGNSLQAFGAASYSLQTFHALGHVFPGSPWLRAASSAPFRSVIYQTVGGEVSFIGPAKLATTDSFRSYRTAQAI